jgi:hypothetical protein
MKKFGIIVVLLLIIVSLFSLFGGKYELTKPLHEQIFSKLSLTPKQVLTSPQMQENRQLILPSSGDEWCKPQEVLVLANDAETPTRDRLMGWDSIDNCCVREVSGFSCALQKEVSVRYCYTASIGGVIKYVLIDGYYGNVDYYNTFVTDVDKEAIPNKACSTEYYPYRV